MIDFFHKSFLSQGYQGSDEFRNEKCIKIVSQIMMLTNYQDFNVFITIFPCQRIKIQGEREKKNNFEHTNYDYPTCTLYSTDKSPICIVILHIQKYKITSTMYKSAET